MGVAVPKRDSLNVVDGILTAEHEYEKQLGELAAQADDLTCLEAHESREAGSVEPRAIDELLEHQRVLRLLDHLVVRVAERRRSIRKVRCPFEQSALENALELQTQLHLSGNHVQADSRP